MDLNLTNYRTCNLIILQESEVTSVPDLKWFIIVNEE